MSAEPLAWLVEVLYDDGEIMHRYVRFDHAAIPRLQSLAQFTVTPLVAAPPQQSVEEVRGLLWDFANEVAMLGRGGGDDRHAAAMQARLLSLLSCAAPPEGAPTYAELVDALREIVEEGFPALCADMERRYDVPPIQVALKGSSRARAMLSRIPKEHAE